VRDASTIKVSSNVVIIVVYLSAPTVSCDGARRQIPDPSVLAVTGIIVVDSLYGVWGGLFGGPEIGPLATIVFVFFDAPTQGPSPPSSTKTQRVAPVEPLQPPQPESSPSKHRRPQASCDLSVSVHTFVLVFCLVFCLRAFDLTVK
jgi:hypothetical protein